MSVYALAIDAGDNLTLTGCVDTLLQRLPRRNVVAVSFDLAVVLFKQQMIMVSELPQILCFKYEVKIFLENGIIGPFFPKPCFESILKQFVRFTITLSSRAPKTKTTNIDKLTQNTNLVMDNY